LSSFAGASSDELENSGTKPAVDKQRNGYDEELTIKSSWVRLAVGSLSSGHYYNE